MEFKEIKPIFIEVNLIHLVQTKAAQVFPRRMSAEVHLLIPSWTLVAAWPGESLLCSPCPRPWWRWSSVWKTLSNRWPSTPLRNILDYLTRQYIQDDVTPLGCRQVHELLEEIYVNDELQKYVECESFSSLDDLQDLVEQLLVRRPLVLDQDE